MSIPHKVQVKIGGAEFSAEGSQESVNEQYQQFLAAVAAVNAAPKANNPPPQVNGRTPAIANGGGLDQTVLDSAFIVQGDLVTLRAFPETPARDADSILLLMYGYKALKGLQDVTAPSLAESARQSGLQIERLDRVMVTYTPQYFRRAGLKRGTRYSLNNQGVSQAEALLREMYA